MSKGKSSRDSGLRAPDSQIIQKSNKNHPTRATAFLQSEQATKQKGSVSFKDSRYK